MSSRVNEVNGENLHDPPIKNPGYANACCNCCLVLILYILHSTVLLCVPCVVGQVDIEGVRLNFWDLGGQEELQSLWDKVRICYML